MPFLRFAVLLLAVVVSACQPAGPTRVLVFSKTAGYRHESIGPAKAALLALGTTNGMVVDTTENSAYFQDDSLKHYAAVVFVSTTGNMLTRREEVALQRYMEAGGGFVGIHAAADAEYDWKWYGHLVGAYFRSHPAQQKAKLAVSEVSHPSTAHLPRSWERFDEWYNFQQIAPGLQVTLTIDERSYTGGENGGTHPMSWFHEVEGGRAWYTALGHTVESYSDSLFLQHVLEGIRYAAGNGRGPDYARARAAYPPNDSSFSRVALTMGTLAEPTEMAVLPTGDVLIAQRGGDVALWSAASKAVRTVGTLAVYAKSKNGSNVEEGLLGITVDPDFAKNRFVYLFYSPADTSVNRLSRFVFDGDSLHMASEKVVLQFHSQREICCHTGGSLAFGPNRTLFVSTGDNSTPFDEAKEKYPSHGYAPTDDRPGHEPYDARRTSGNTNDLRGKILRIRVREDGGYDIPEGNLFAPGTPNTKPEIFVMGNRNPYRVSVDPQDGVLFWGEVGPDANTDSLDVRGPRGYDEINRAARAGNYGWPLFVGNNYAYRRWDYATGASGPAYDAATPLNESRNNTGVRELPPAMPALIWYPYAASGDFPQVGEGGRTAMAGPFYRAARYAGVGTALPSYYDGKLFVYDWIRHWIYAVTLDAEGRYVAMERIAAHEKFSAPIDMELGPDGRLYVLEYGKAWFAKNPDAGLSRLEFTNR